MTELETYKELVREKVNAHPTACLEGKQAFLKSIDIDPPHKFKQSFIVTIDADYSGSKRMEYANQGVEPNAVESFIRKGIEHYNELGTFHAKDYIIKAKKVDE